jgi:hypothetical protein
MLGDAACERSAHRREGQETTTLATLAGGAVLGAASDMDFGGGGATGAVGFFTTTLTAATAKRALHSRSTTNEYADAAKRKHEIRPTFAKHQPRCLYSVGVLHLSTFADHGDACERGVEAVLPH